MKLINIYLLIINLVTFIIMGKDKFNAIKKKFRISEQTILTLCILGGTIGTLLGMIVFRHKIRKIKFLLILPIFIIINLLIYKYLIN